MRIEPRQQVLEIWQSIAHYTKRDTNWSWDGRDGANSISDAEHLLSIMYPSTELESFKLDSPDQVSEDVLTALEEFGDSRQIPKLLVDVLGEYMETYSDSDGSPTFGAGSYFRRRPGGGSPEPEQLALDMVDSLSMSITLCLTTLAFLKGFTEGVTNLELKKKINTLEEATSLRLTSAIVGLLRSFTVMPFSPESEQGRNLVEMLSQGAPTVKSALEEFHKRTRSVRASLRDARLGLSQDDSLENPNMLFELGWSWGIVEGAPEVKTEELVGEQPDGVASRNPGLYFTVVALDGIADLFSERTRVLGLLSVEQQRLKDALQLRRDLTLGYWAALATMGARRWALEDIPWRTSDGAQSDYFSLLVATIFILDMDRGEASEDDLGRTVSVLEELSTRGRINRRPFQNDPAIGLHNPGVRLPLAGAERLGPPIDWRVADFASLLFKRASQGAGLARNTATRDRLVRISEESLDHLWDRRIKTGFAKGLWDDPSDTFGPPVGDVLQPSWYLTERVLECLVTAASTIGKDPVRSNLVINMATELIAEAEHLFSREQFQASAAGGRVMRETLESISNRIARARDLLRERPGTAQAIVMKVLRDLDELDVARQDAGRSM